MALQLNEQVVPYKEFYGRITEQMPLLVEDGRVPMSSADLMDRRLEVRGHKFSPEVRSAWHDNYFYTSDGILYHPDRKIKVVPDFQSLRELHSKSKLIGGALVLEPGVYEATQAEEFTKENLKNIIKNSLSRDVAKSNHFWKILARDQNRLNAYVDFVFDETKRRFSYDQNMGLYIGTTQKEPTARSWVVDWLEFRSDAFGRGHLGSDDGRLVGVAPEAPNARKAVEKPLEQRV